MGGVDGTRVNGAAAVERVQGNRDEVQMSAGARAVGQAIAAAHAAPEIDVATVSALQSQIAAGTYHVDAAEVAQAMLRPADG